MPASQARKQRRFVQRARDAGMPVDSVYHMDMPLRAQEPGQLQSYRQYFKYITYAEALTRIKWEGLPETIDARFLEMSLFLYGQATITHIDGDAMAQIASPYSLYDKQANYNDWLAISAMGDIERRSPQSGVLVFDNMLRTSPIALLDPLIEDASQAMTSASSNLIQQRYGVFFQATKNNERDAKRLSQMLGMGEVGAVTIKEVGSNLNIQTMNPDVKDITSTAFDAKKEYLNEIHSFLGTDYIPHEKAERLLTDEAQASQDKVNRQREFFLEPRRKACKQLKALYGWDVTVKWVTDMTPSDPYDGDSGTVSEDEREDLENDS